MRSYHLSPFATFVESHLLPAGPQYAVFHRLTGQMLEPEPAVRAFLQAAQMGSQLSLTPEQFASLGQSGHQIARLIELELLIPIGHDPLASFVDYCVGRPLQNPAITFQNEQGEVLVVSTSMAERVYSPERGQLPEVLEKRLPELATALLLAADGTKTLAQIHESLQRNSRPLLADQEFRDAIDFLSTPERQLIKFAPTPEGLANPFYPANLVPRNFYHASRWTERGTAKSIADFHVEGIEDAVWEFDVIEPTVNHGLRFPSSLLSGLDYGTRFCDALLEHNVFSGSKHGDKVEILEVGGGTGSFARSFIPRAQEKLGPISYHIMDLSPALTENQRRLLSDVEPPIGFINQDATEFDLPGCKFDLIVSNEVIADFPVAAVERRASGNSPAQFNGDGAQYVKKYSLPVNDAPDYFYVNAGVFSFLERAWHHLNPGGALVLSEYGSTSRYPVESFHLNHPEFTIHFGHVSECARRIGFECQLHSLMDFLGIDERRTVLSGREEHILCLNHVFEKLGTTLPFALFSEENFKLRYAELAARLKVSPIRFLPLLSHFHYGPNLDDFLVLGLSKPRP